MNFVTSIGVNDSVQSIDNLLQHLRGSNIAVDGPLPDPANAPAPDVPAAQYQVNLMLFQSIARSSFHIIDNPDGVITPELALQILYAMSKERPVIIAVQPIFSPDVDSNTRQTIQKHIDQFTVLDVNTASSTEIASAAQLLPEKAEYNLSEQELESIKYQSRTFFRDLLRNQ